MLTAIDMKRLNRLNQLYILVLMGLVVATVVKLWKYNGGSRFYYSGSLTAPKLYPVRIQEAYFLLSNDETANISNSEVNDDRGSEWGQGDFEETHERLPLPTRLVLSYVSYRDQKFYSDTIHFPSPVLDSIFRNSKKNGTQTSIYKPGDAAEGLNFLIGIANKGNIVVWLQGNNYEHVLLKHQIAAREPVSGELYYEKPMNKTEYLKERFKYLSDEIVKKIAEGADDQANYADSATNYIRKPI